MKIGVAENPCGTEDVLTIETDQMDEYGSIINRMHTGGIWDSGDHFLGTMPTRPRCGDA